MIISKREKRGGYVGQGLCVIIRIIRAGMVSSCKGIIIIARTRTSTRRVQLTLPKRTLS